MRITLRQLAVFDLVAKNLNFTRAAEQLHLSQPAVSMQIKQLEEGVGLPLFEKFGKKILLTEAGSELHHYCRSIQELLLEAEEVMDHLKGAKKGHIAISVASTANYFATNLLAAFKKKYSDTTFSLDVTNRETLLRQLENNEKDLVIMGQPPQDLDLVTDGFMENPLVVIAPPDHELLQVDKPTMKQLENEVFVVREIGSGTRIAMERFFEAQGVSLQAGMEMNSNEAIKQSVEAGLGLGIVSIHTLALELASGILKIVKVEGFPILRHWYVVHRQSKRLSPVAESFRKFVLAEAGNLVKLPEYRRSQN